MLGRMGVDSKVPKVGPLPSGVDGPCGTAEEPCGCQPFESIQIVALTRASRLTMSALIVSAPGSKV